VGMVIKEFWFDYVLNLRWACGICFLLWLFQDLFFSFFLVDIYTKSSVRNGIRFHLCSPSSVTKQIETFLKGISDGKPNPELTREFQHCAVNTEFSSRSVTGFHFQHPQITWLSFLVIRDGTKFFHQKD
jgi:hypothetical protein